MEIGKELQYKMQYQLWGAAHLSAMKRGSRLRATAAAALSAAPVRLKASSPADSRLALSREKSTPGVAKLSLQSGTEPGSVRPRLYKSHSIQGRSIEHRCAPHGFRRLEQQSQIHTAWCGSFARDYGIPNRLGSHLSARHLGAHCKALSSLPSSAGCILYLKSCIYRRRKEYPCIGCPQLAQSAGACHADGNTPLAAETWT